MKTSELQGARLDWATAQAIRKNVKVTQGSVFGQPDAPWFIATPEGCPWRPTVDGSVLSRLTEQWVTTLCTPRDGYWWAHAEGRRGRRLGEGETVAEAVCRAIVAAHLDDEVELPLELLP